MNLVMSDQLPGEIDDEALRLAAENCIRQKYGLSEGWKTAAIKPEANGLRVYFEDVSGDAKSNFYMSFEEIRRRDA